MPGTHAAVAATAHPAPTPSTESGPAPKSSGRRIVLGLVTLLVLIGAGYYLTPTVIRAFKTVSTDDAYINGHVTFLAPRVAGQVSRVLVDDNYRVKKGDLLVQLDKEPLQVQLAIKQAAVESANANLIAAQAQVRGFAAQARAYRFQLDHAIEDVHTQVALLQARIATLRSKEATRDRAHADVTRAQALFARSAIGREELDQRREADRVAEAMVTQAQEEIYETRVSLGLAARPEKGDLSEVPRDLDQNFSTVRQALGLLISSVAQLGYTPTSWSSSPKQIVEEFYKQDPKGNLDTIFARLLSQAPSIKQYEAKVLEARSDLEQAKLNLRYCDIVSEIDGVVTRRNVNPGNNVSVGQSLMAVRSLTEIWIDANFKETQLADLRIGQRVLCEVDMYGSRRDFEGRITGFTMGTGQTLALLPPQNATGNFVKIVQRLPVRIELTNYKADAHPLFVGLSVVPYVYYKEKPEGPHAGEVLQPLFPLPQGPTAPSPGDASQPSAPAPKVPSGS